MNRAHRPGPTVNDWRKAVFKAQSVSWRTKTYLLYLADHMKLSTRQVCRQRHLVAADLGVSQRTVDRMAADAHDAGFLATIVRGRKGTTAVYRGVFPRPQRDNSCRPETPFSATLGGHLNCPETVALKAGSARQQDGAPLVTTEPPCDVCNGWGCERCA